MVFRKCLYSSADRVNKRSNNSFALTYNGNFVQIKYFLVDNMFNREYTICKTVNTEAALFKSHIRKINNISNAEIAIETNTLRKICVFIKCNNILYLCAIPNTY